MKIILLILLFPIIGYSQADSTKVANDQLIRVAETIKRQSDTIDTQQKIINEYAVQDSLQSIVFLYQNREIANLNSQLEISNSVMGNYKDHLRKDRRIRNSRIFYFVGGVVTTYVTSLIIKNVK